jgi:YfiR/HmsC-like
MRMKPLPIVQSSKPALGGLHSMKFGRRESVRRQVRFCSRLMVLSFLLLTAPAIRGKAESGDEEYQIKAAFLYHFAQLVDWPEMPEGPDNSLLLCTIGEDPFEGSLEATVAGKAVGTKAIRVRHLRQAEDMQACQILFLDKAQNKYIPTLLAGLQNAPVLTVGETSGFLSAGGMICFLLVENKVRFAINLKAANSARIKIGARLLILAQSVVGARAE